MDLLAHAGSERLRYGGALTISTYVVPCATSISEKRGGIVSPEAILAFDREPHCRPPLPGRGDHEVRAWIRHSWENRVVAYDIPQTVNVYATILMSLKVPSLVRWFRVRDP